MVLAIIFTIVLMVVTLSVVAVGSIFDYILSVIILFMLVYIPVLVYRTYHMPRVRDHLVSRWEMDRNTVAFRLEHAMKGRGVQVTGEDTGRDVVFPLPPLGITVTPEGGRTAVYVGPVTDAEPKRVEALKAFVERALA